jgi:tripeptidyl-peptidase I
LQVKIALVQNNVDAGYDQVMSVSHPDSESYGKHLSTEAVERLFAPSDESVNVVRQWLAAAADLDLDDIQVSNNGWLAANMSVAAAEHAFSTSYYEHEDRQGYLRIGCDEYYLPANIQQHVDYVVPGVKSSPPLHKRAESRTRPPWGPGRPGKRPPHWNPPGHSPWHPPPGAHNLPQDLQDCGRNITPTCIRALYDIPRAHHTDEVNALGLFEEGDFYAQSDLNSFFAEYAPYVPQGTHPVPAFIGKVWEEHTCCRRFLMLLQ